MTESPKSLNPKPEVAPYSAAEAKFTYIRASKLRSCLRTQTSEKPKGPTTSPVTLFMCLILKGKQKGVAFLDKVFVLAFNSHLISQ